MASPPRNLPARWLVVALPVVGALAMVTVLLLDWNHARRSADLVLRGEAALLVERVGRAARETPSAVSDEGLRALVDQEARAGLRFAAAVQRDGQVVASSGPPPAELASLSELRFSDLRRDGTSAWARTRNLVPRDEASRDDARPREDRPPRDDSRPPRADRPPREDRSPRDDRPPRDDPAPPRDDSRPPGAAPRGTQLSLLLRFEPRLVGEIDRAAQATAVVGVAGALALVLLGALALRLLRRNDEAQQRLAQEKRLASLGAMSAVVAHELRNPLAALKGHAQLLVETLETQPRARAQAEQVVNGAVRLERLSASLLELARTGTLTREETSPASLVRDAAGQSGGDRVRVDDAAAPPSWSLDPFRFPQVVVNLVDNALQAAPDQPVEVRVATEGDRLVVEVRDHGPGVPPADRERIFEPFVTQRARGVGLGLAVARQVVELHGGTLSVSDAPGGGASFRVEIPSR